MVVPTIEATTIRRRGTCTVVVTSEDYCSHKRYDADCETPIVTGLRSQSAVAVYESIHRPGSARRASQSATVSAVAESRGTEECPARCWA